MLRKWRNMPGITGPADVAMETIRSKASPCAHWGSFAGSCLCLYQVGMQTNPLNTCTPVPMARRIFRVVSTLAAANAVGREAAVSLRRRRP